MGDMGGPWSERRPGRELSGTGHSRRWVGTRTMGWRWLAEQDTAQVQCECQCDGESTGQSGGVPMGNCHQGLDHCQLWKQPQGDPGEPMY